MKSKAFIYTAVILSLVATSAASAFASGSDEADLRPVWLSDQSVYSQNSALLYSDHDPSFLPPTLAQQIQSNHSVREIEEQYSERTRDYEMRQNYGLATTVDEQNYVNDVSGMGRSMFTAARLTPVRQYQQGFQQSSKDGEISKPIAVAGGAVALGSGTPIPFNLGDGTTGTWSGDLLNEHGELDVVSPVVNAKVEMNLKDLSQDPTQPMDPNAAVEKYRVTVNREIAFQVNSSVVYGSTSNSFTASLSRAICDNISGAVTTTRPAGQNISGNPAEVTGGVSYGISF